MIRRPDVTGRNPTAPTGTPPPHDHLAPGGTRRRDLGRTRRRGRSVGRAIPDLRPLADVGLVRRDQSPSDAVDPQASVRDASPWAAPSTGAEPQAPRGLADEGLADDADAPGRVEPSQEESPAPDPIAPPAYLPPLPAYRPVGADDETRSYTPPPELRAGWQRTSWDSPVSATPEVWFEPVPVSAPLPEPRIAPRGRGAGLPTVLGASLLAAILASSGTLLALSASGALEPSTAPPTSPVATAAAFSSPIAGSSEAPAPVPAASDQTAAVIAAATNVSPAVVTIDAVAGATRTTLLVPRGRRLRASSSTPTGWILTNHHVVQGSDQLTVTLKDGRQFDGTVYGVDTLTDLAIVKIEGIGPADGQDRRLEHHPGGPARDRHRQPAGPPTPTPSRAASSRHSAARSPSRTARGSTTSSRQTPRSTRATAAVRCSTRTATSSASIRPSPARRRASASRSRSTSLGRSCSRLLPARSSPGRGSASATSPSTCRSRPTAASRSTMAPGFIPGPGRDRPVDPRRRTGRTGRQGRHEGRRHHRQHRGHHARRGTPARRRADPVRARQDGDPRRAAGRPGSSCSWCSGPGPRTSSFPEAADPAVLAGRLRQSRAPTSPPASGHHPPGSDADGALSPVLLAHGHLSPLAPVLGAAFPSAV